MPVMRHLNVGGTTYDTVGEASVTQVQTSGTKIATVSIDGTSTDLYAPAGGSSVEPSSTTPSMDGTAAVGTATTYARADHVHPTDTSRAAASHSHAISDVTNLQTTLDGKAASTHSHAIGDLPTGTTSTTVALGNHTHSEYAASSHSHAASDINSGTLDIARIPTGSTASTVAVGNHTHSGYASMATATATLGTNGWTSDSITVSVTGVTASNNVIVAPAPASTDDWAAAGIVCTAQGAGTLTFTRKQANTSSITANVLILS